MKPRRFAIRVASLDATEPGGIRWTERATGLSRTQAILQAVACPVRARVMCEGVVEFENQRQPAQSYALLPAYRRKSA